LSLLETFLYRCTIILVCASGCTSNGGHGKNDQPDACSSEVHAAFLLTITAGDAALPADLELQVQYGGFCEIYDLDRREVMACADGGLSGSVFCRVNPPAAEAVCDTSPMDDDAGAPGSMDHVLSCCLWTPDATSVAVTSSQYAAVEQDLSPESNDCGLMTVAVPIDLMRPDAGHP
jgi:hypothetical protein